MKKTFLILIILFAFVSVNAQYRYSVRAMGYGGMVVAMGDKHTETLTKRQKGFVFGGEIDFEFKPTGKQKWQHFWRFPTLGLGVVGIDLGNPKMLGQAIAVYPYLLVPVVDTRYFMMNYKVGAGVSFITKYYGNTPHGENTLHGINGEPYQANAVIGSLLNIYLNTGFNFEFPINDQFSITADLGYSHMSNGSVITPNKGFNILYAQVGAKYSFINCPECKNLVKNPAYELPYDFMMNIGVSGGVRQLYYQDKKFFFVGDLHIGMTAPLAKWYALGGGFDFFADGAFNQRYLPESNKFKNSFHRYYTPENKLENKFCFGISINNEFIIGRFTGIFDWGIYLYNPLKNLQPGDDVVKNKDKNGNIVPFKKGIFYKYNIDNEDGWNYFRLGLRYRVWDNLFVSVNLKTHLQKAEMITFGIGYYLPFARAGKHATMKKELKNYYFYRFGKKEKTDFPTPWQ